MAMITSNKTPKTGYNKDSSKSFLADAGVWVKGFSYDKETEKYSYELIGATSGGSKITLKYNYRQVEVDGVFTTPVGADMIESAEGVAELTLIEFSKETLKTLILAEVKTPGPDDGVPEGYEIITPKGKVTKDDYVENLAYIGTLMGSIDPVIIIFHHAICTSGLEFEPQDKSEAKYTATYELRAGEGDFDNMAMPVTIWYPSLDDAPAGRALTNVSIDGIETNQDSNKNLTPKQKVAAHLDEAGIAYDYEKSTQAQLEELLAGGIN